MAFSDGDPFVSGSLYSFQQGNRMMQNYRGATVPSNLQDGALWSDSDDDRLWHQGASLDEVFTEQTTLTWENLLANSGFGVWSQSDASKGLATITYDQGAKGAGAAPSVGDAVVGGTSGATAKVISYTTATGAWATDDATGIVTVGAVSHDFAFVDNETITFGGVETAVVNMPDSAVQVGLVQNGGFATDTDPPPGWTGLSDAGVPTLTTEGAGKVGNCIMIKDDAGNAPHAYQEVTVEEGKIYKFSCYVKAGTEATYNVLLRDIDNGANFFDTGNLEETAGDWSTRVLHTFEAPAGCSTVRIRLYQKAAGATDTTLYFDEITLYEITPCCTAADSLSPDTWGAKDTTIDIYRQHNDGGTLTKDGSFYSLKLVPSATLDYLNFPDGTLRALAEWYQQFAGRMVTFGAWVKTSTASHARLNIEDDSTTTNSSYHTGGGAWEWIEVSMTIGASPTLVQVQLQCVASPAVNGDTIVYVSQPMLVFGSHIGEGNYQPKQGEIIWLEAEIDSNLLDATDNHSNAETDTINIEADSDGCLSKGCKAIQMFSEVRDSGSLAAGNAGIILYQTAFLGSKNSCAGKTNDIYSPLLEWILCDSAGDVKYYIYATGASTFQISSFKYFALQVN